MPTSTPADPPTPTQLRFPTGDPPQDADATAALNRTAMHLLKIRVACELLQDIANRDIALDDDNIAVLRGALTFLDSIGLPGRLGYLARLINAGPVTNYDALVDDLAFAIHLNDPKTQTP